jgi:benzoate-CoA ligase
MTSPEVTAAAAPPEDFNFAAHLLQLNSEHPQAVAYIDDAGELTYGELAIKVRRFAHSLIRLGFGEEQRLILLSEDRNAWPIAFLGAMYAGVVPLPLNTLLTSDDYAYLIDHSGAAGAVVSSSLLPVFLAAQQKAKRPLCRWLIGIGDNGCAQDAVSFEAMVGNDAEQLKATNSHRDAIAFWLYSSGSTGKPKGVVHTHANLYWTSALYASAVLQLGAHDRVFSAAKLFFAYGLGNAITFPQTVGATAILMAERATPDAVFKIWSRARPSIFCAAPTLFANMLASPNLPPCGPDNLRLCISAGEALPKEVGERFSAHFGVPVLDGLGSTEMLHIFVSNQRADNRYGTTGRPVPGYQVELRGDHGQGVASGEIGDLWVKGPSAALMYWNDRTRSCETFQGSWVRTGDKFSMDDRGYLTYAGRNDDMLKISGQYVSPFEVESTLLTHSKVLEAAVVGVTDHVGLSKCKAFIVLRCADDADESVADELKEFVKGRLAPFKRPHLIEFVTGLPKTATGKIQRFRLRESAAAIPR